MVVDILFFSILKASDWPKLHLRGRERFNNLHGYRLTCHLCSWCQVWYSTGVGRGRAWRPVFTGLLTGQTKLTEVLCCCYTFTCCAVLLLLCLLMKGYNGSPVLSLSPVCCCYTTHHSAVVCAAPRPRVTSTFGGGTGRMGWAQKHASPGGNTSRVSPNCRTHNTTVVKTTTHIQITAPNQTYNKKLYTFYSTVVEKINQRSSTSYDNRTSIGIIPM